MLESERRSFARKRICLDLDATTRGCESHEHSRLRLRIGDLSLGGLSAMTTAPLQQGARLAVRFPPQGQCGGCVANGIIVRCQRLDCEYQIGMEFDRYPSPRGRMPYVPSVPAMLSA